MTQELDKEACRKAFEEWAKDNFQAGCSFAYDSDTGQYNNPFLQHSWFTWQHLTTLPTGAVEAARQAIVDNLQMEIMGDSEVYFPDGHLHAAQACLTAALPSLMSEIASLKQEVEAVRQELGELEELRRFKRNTEAMLYMIGEDVAFMGSNWADDAQAKGYPKECYLGTVGCLMMNDTFYYASADGEDVPYDEWPRVKQIYEEWGQDGIIAWVALRRGHDPQIPQNVTNKFKAAKAALAKIESRQGLANQQRPAEE